MDSIFSMSINFLNSQHHFFENVLILVRRNLILRNYIKRYIKKLSIFHFFRVLCFSKYAANAPKDKIKTTKTEKKNKMIEL